MESQSPTTVITIPDWVVKSILTVWANWLTIVYLLNFVAVPYIQIGFYEYFHWVGSFLQIMLVASI